MAQKRVKSRAVGWLAFACIAILLVYEGKPGFSNAAQPARAIADPVTALQMARNVEEVDDVLGDAPSPDRETMRIKQYIDFAFIPTYAGLFIALGLMFRSRLAIIAAASGVAAAIFDVTENFAILRVVDTPLPQTTQAMIDAIRHASYPKWILAFVADALFAAVFWKSGHWAMRLMAGLFLAAAGIGFYGIYDNSFLAWSGIPTFGGLIAMVILFLRPSF
jgi:hypothetical protein